MAKKKAKKVASTNLEAHRVNMTLTPEEYEMLAAAAAKEMRTPTLMAKYLVMNALTEPTEGEKMTQEEFDRSNGQDG